MPQSKGRVQSRKPGVNSKQPTQQKTPKSSKKSRHRSGSTPNRQHISERLNHYLRLRDGQNQAVPEEELEQYQQQELLVEGNGRPVRYGNSCQEEEKTEPSRGLIESDSSKSSGAKSSFREKPPKYGETKSSPLSPARSFNQIKDIIRVTHNEQCTPRALKDDSERAF